VSDRVSERWRAAQLVRHYRDQEKLTIAEIAQRLVRAEATVKAYLYDPWGITKGLQIACSLRVPIAHLSRVRLGSARGLVEM
jgi:hypothetical protein